MASVNGIRAAGPGCTAWRRATGPDATGPSGPGAHGKPPESRRGPASPGRPGDEACPAQALSLRPVAAGPGPGRAAGKDPSHPGRGIPGRWRPRPGAKSRVTDTATCTQSR